MTDNRPPLPDTELTLSRRLVVLFAISATLWFVFSNLLLYLAGSEQIGGLFWHIVVDSGFVATGALIVFRAAQRKYRQIDAARRAAIAQVAESERRFFGILEHAPFGVHLYRLEAGERLIFQGANAAADRILGVANSDFIGREILDAFPGLRDGEVPAAYREVCRSGVPWHSTQFVYEDDSIRGVFDIYAFATLPGLLATFFTDVTERYRAEESDKELARLKDEMISSVSHEMRTPLTAMLGFVEYMLQHEVTRAQQLDYLGIVYKETERLSELVGTFLDFQRLRSGLAVRKDETVSMELLLHEAAQLFTHYSHEHRLTVDIAGMLPPLRGNYQQLRQMINNLTSNAIKYSPGGGEIVLSARHAGDELLLTVADSGIGIAEQDCELIFQSFFRADNSDTRKVGGTGLGLALVREIVKLHNGTIGVESALGRGSVFTVRLPLA